MGYEASVWTMFQAPPFKIHHFQRECKKCASKIAIVLCNKKGGVSLKLKPIALEICSQLAGVKEPWHVDHTHITRDHRETSTQNWIDKNVLIRIVKNYRFLKRWKDCERCEIFRVDCDWYEIFCSQRSSWWDTWPASIARHPLKHLPTQALCQQGAWWRGRLERSEQDSMLKGGLAIFCFFRKTPQFVTWYAIRLGWKLWSGLHSSCLLQRDFST